MRRRRAEKRDVRPDPKYNSKTISKFINVVMLCGKKTKAERIVYKSLDIVGEKAGGKNGLEVFERAINNARPLLQVKARRVGGATYQVPIEVEPERGIAVAMRWVRDFARGRKGKPMEMRLADELWDAYNNTGAAIKKREETHKMAEANKAFSHYRW